MSLPPVPGGLAPLPDAEKAILDFLAGRAEITALGQVTVGDRLPEDYDGSQLVVTGDRIGGAADHSTIGWLETVHLDLSSWGPDKTAAAALSAVVRYLISICVYCDAPNVVFADSREIVGPQWLPDATADYPQSGRYLLQVAVTLHPAA